MESLSDSDPDFWELGDKGEGGGRKAHRRSKGFSAFPGSGGEDDRPAQGPTDTHPGTDTPNTTEHSTTDYNTTANTTEHSTTDYDTTANTTDYNTTANTTDYNTTANTTANTPHHNTKTSGPASGEKDVNSDASDDDDDDDEAKEEEKGDEEKGDSTDDDDDYCDGTGEREEGSGGSSSGSGTNTKSQWLVEQHLLTPQQKLKLALYRGRKLYGAREGEGAVREFVVARALARVVHGDQHWRYCRCQVFLAKAYLYLKEYAPQAEAQAREALDTLGAHLATHLAPAKKPQVHHTLLWGFLVCGEARTRLGQLSAAQEALERALHHTRIYARMVLRWKKQLSPSLTIDLPLDLQVKVLCAQAALYTKQHRLHKAKEKLECSIALIEKKGSGTEDPCLVPPLQQLGTLLLEHPQGTQDDTQDTQDGTQDTQDDTRDTDTGLDLLTRVVHITQVSNRPGSVAECEARGLLLEHRLHHRRIATPEALRELHKLGLLFSRLHGEHNPRTAAIHNLTVQVLVQEENYPEATKHLLAHLKHCKDLHGDFTPQVCGVLRQLSRVHALAGDEGRAALALDQCLQVETLLYGTSSRRAQASRLRLQDMMQKLPLSLRKRMYRRHPDLQSKPRFHNA